MPPSLKRTRGSLQVFLPHLLPLILLILQLGAPAAAQSQGTPEGKAVQGHGQETITPDLSKKNVLILHAYTYETASSIIMDPIFLKGFTDAGLGAFNLHFEYMDVAKHPRPADRNEFAKYLGFKYEKTPIDLIIALHSPGLNFLLEEGKRLFPGVPVINAVAGSEFLNVEDLRSLYERRIHPPKRPFVVLPYSMDVESTLKSIMSLRPDTRTLAVITGSGFLDRTMDQAVRRGLQEWKGSFSTESFDSLPLEKVLGMVGNLTPKTVILFTNFSADPDGRTYSPPEVVRKISKAANAPVFGLLDTLLENGGIVGGVMLTHRGEASRAVQLSLEILRGKLPGGPITISRAPFVPIFDWEQLRRWELSEEKLPAGSIVLNRPKTLWGEYKGFVIGSIAVFLAQGLLVIGLLIQRNLKRKAEASLDERLRFERLVSQISARFLNVTPDEVDGEIEGALKRIVDFFRVTQSVLIKGSREKHRAEITHAAHADDVPPTPARVNLYPALPWTSKMCEQGEIIRGATLDGLPAEAAVDKEFYRNLGIRSILIVPVMIEGSPVYALAISSRREERVWPEDYIPRVTLLGEILVSTLERKRAESSAMQKTEELDRFFNITPDLLCIANTEGYFVRLNPAAETILGCTREELMATRIIDFIHPEDLDRSREAASTLASQSPLFSFENRYRCKEGAYRWLQWSAAPAGNLIYAAARDVTERKESEESLRKAEEKYRHLFEGALEGIYETSREGKNLTANPALARMLGYDSPEEVSSSITDAANQLWVNPNDRKTYIRLLEEGDVVLGYECQFWRKDRTKIWVAVSGRRICGPDGETLYYSGFIEDITGRKRAEEALRKSEQDAQRTAREALAMAEIGRIMSSTLTIEEVYEAFAAVTRKIIPFDRIVINLVDTENRTTRNVYIAGGKVGDREIEKVYPLEGSGNAEMLRTKSAFLLQTEDFEDLKDRYPMLLSTFQAGFRSILNVPLFSRGEVIGGLLLRSYKAYAYADEDVRLAERIGNQIGGAIANAQLFMKQKRTEEALRASEERFRQVAENVGDFIWEVDAEGLYRYTSPSVERILGYTPEELVGKKHFYDLFAPEVREELKEAALQSFAAKQPFRAFPNPNVSKEGKVVHLETRGAPVLDAAGNLAGYRGADTDVTEPKRAEEEIRENQKRLEELVEELRRYQEHLEERVKERTAELLMAMNRAETANRAKSAFLANMSHELRTPLTSILGISELMERDRDFPQRHREVLEILSRSGKHLFELIDDILEISRIEADQSSVVRTDFDLHRFLDDLMIMALENKKKGMDVVLERDSGLPKYIRTDERRLRQILLNLLGNAVKFTEEGWVRLKVKQNKRHAGVGGGSVALLEFEVEDTGIGIAEEDRERIFEPFVQLPGRKAIGGAGLGLPLSRKLARLLGGEITVSSEAGRGSTFRLEVGVETAETSDIPVGEVSRHVTGLASGQPDYGLLIVDDNLENRLLLRQLLEPVGFRIWEAPGGREAIDLHQKVQPDLIWMDIRMPGMDGYEAARRIREAEKGKRNPDGREVHTPILALTAGVMEQKQSSPLAGVFDDWVYKPFRETELFEKLEKHLGVQFVYQSPPSPEEKGSGEPVLQAGDLAGLPRDWLERFLGAVKRGRPRQMHDLIEEIRPDFAVAARALTDLMNLYKFETLITLTEKALQG